MVQIVGDTSLPFPDTPLRRDFLQMLGDAEVDGIPSAVRRRFQWFLESGENSWTVAHGWFDLVGRHGDAGDIAWLAARNESTQIRNAGEEAIWRSTNPAARAYVERLLQQPDAVLNAQNRRRILIDTWPEKALELLGDRLVRSGGASGDWSEWAQLLPAERFPEAVEFLQGLRGWVRFQAIRAVEVLESRGFDVSRLEAVVLAPVEYLERATPNDCTHWSAAGYAIEYHPCTWSERAATALEAAGRRLGQGRLLNQARQVRAGLASPWKDQ